MEGHITAFYPVRVRTDIVVAAGRTPTVNSVRIFRRFSFFSESKVAFWIENVLRFFAACRTAGAGFVISDGLRFV